MAHYRAVAEGKRQSQVAAEAESRRALCARRKARAKRKAGGAESAPPALVRGFLSSRAGPAPPRARCRYTGNPSIAATPTTASMPQWAAMSGRSRR